MTSPLPLPVQASLDATNAGDPAAFLDTFTPDGAVDDWGRLFEGPARITEWSNNEYIGKNMTLEVSSVEIDGDHVIVIAQVGGDGFNGPSTFTYRLAGDKVSRMTIRE